MTTAQGTHGTKKKGLFGISWWIVCAVIVAIALLLLWDEHESHILRILPFAILAACPLIHMFGHGHGGHGGHGDQGTHGDHGSHGDDGEQQDHSGHDHQGGERGKEQG